MGSRRQRHERRHRARVLGNRGFTLIEVTIILLVLVILSTIMLPQLGNFNRLARYVVAYEDVAAMCATLKKFLDEVMVPGPYMVPGGVVATPTVPVGLLASGGIAPGIGGAAAVSSPPNIVAGNWNIDCPNEGTTFRATPDIVNVAPATTTEFNCDLFDHHLQVNNPGGGGVYDLGDLPQHRYKNQSEATTVGAFFGWRGPYFNQINSDPWGARTMANVFGLHSDVDGNGFSTAVVCISFGPNSIAETSVNMAHPDGFGIGGDDIAAVLSAMGPF